MSEIIFRRARREDLDAIVCLLADDVLGKTREDSSRPLNSRYTEAFAAIDADPNQMLVVLDDDGIIVGCLQLSFVPGLSRLGLWRGQIESVRVTSDRRGDRLGHRLFAWAIDECRRRGCGLVQLTTDKTRPDALRFYESLGFKATHVGMKLDL
jgi:GNAT superfamily N-acetyltransferase